MKPNVDSSGGASIERETLQLIVQLDELEPVVDLRLDTRHLVIILLSICQASSIGTNATILSETLMRGDVQRARELLVGINEQIVSFRDGLGDLAKSALARAKNEL
jgi:hypothetical protein